MRLLPRSCLPLALPLTIQPLLHSVWHYTFVSKLLPVDSHRILMSVFFLVLINFGCPGQNHGLPSERKTFAEDTSGDGNLSFFYFIALSIGITSDYFQSIFSFVYVFLCLCLSFLCLKLSKSRSALKKKPKPI